MALDLKITASLQDNLSNGLNLISESLAKTKKEAEKTKKAMGNLLSSVGNAQNILGGLLNALRSGSILGFGQMMLGASGAVDTLSETMKQATAGATGFGSSLKALGTLAWSAVGPVGLVAGAVASLGVVGYKSAKAASELDKHLDSLLSLTGLEDSGIKEMSKAAVDMSKEFGTAAADIVDSFKLIGGLSPELLKDTDALKSVTEAANTLALAGEIEVVDAAKAITGTMNQMGASASQAKDIINTLAAGAKEGSYEIADLTEVFAKAGTMAKSSGMNFTELTALVEAVGGKFTEASVLGTSLNSTLIALSVQGNDKFKPAVVGMQQALDNLAKAELSDQEMKDLVGASNVKLLKSMIELKGEYTRLNGAISGTNTAYDMAALNTDNLEGTLNKLKASWDALLLTIGQSSVMQGIITLFLMLADGIREVINTISGVLDELPKFSGGIGIFEALAAVLKVVGGLFKALFEIIGVGVSAIIQIWNGLFYTVTTILKGIWRVAKNTWDYIKNLFGDNTIFNGFINAIKTVIRWLGKIIPSINSIKKSWIELKKWLGMNVQEPKKKEETKNTKTETTKTEDDNKGDGKGGGGTKTVKVKVEAEPGSIDALKKKLSDLQKSLTSKNLSVVDIEKTKKQIEDLQKEIDKKEMELGIKAKPGSLEYIENEISKIDAKLKKLDPKIDFVTIQKLKIDKAALEDTKKEVEDALKPIEVEVVRKRIRNIDEIDPKTIGVKEAEEVLSQLNSDLKLETDRTSENYQKLIDRIKKWTAVKEQKEIEIKADLSNAAKGSMKWLSEKKAYWQGKVDLTVYGTPEYNEAMQHVNELTKQENKIRLQMEIDGMSDLEKVYTFMDGFHAIDGVVGSFESLSNAIEENANAWEIFMGVLQVFESVMSAINAVTEIANMLSGISAGVKIAETAATVSASAAEKEKMGTDAAAVAPTTAQTVANKALEASFLDLASAEIFAAHASIPFVGVGLATGFITTMMSVLAATKAATMAMMAFETGGIVGGNSYHGDKLIARVNSGEMILNGRLLKNLFDAINENRISNENSNRLYGEVKVKGQDLYIALSNLGKVKAPLGKHIGIR